MSSKIVIKKEHNNMPLRQYAKEKVKSWIKEQKLQPGDKIISQNELSKVLKIAPATAYKALDELVSDGIIYRIRGKGTFVAQKTTNPHFKNIGLFLFGMNTELNHISSPNHYEIVHGITNTVESRGYYLTFMAKKGNTPNLNSIRSKHIDGAIVVGAHQPETQKLIQRLKKTNIKYMLIDRYNKNMDINSIEVFGTVQLLKVFKYLQSLGHSRILNIGNAVVSNKYSSGAVARQIAKKNGMIKEFFNIHLDNYSPLILKNRISEVLSSHDVSVIIMQNLNMAKALLEAIGMLNLKIPQDISLLAVERRQIKINNKTITTFGGRSSVELGEKTANVLIDILENKISEPVAEEMDLDFLPGDTVRIL